MDHKDPPELTVLMEPLDHKDPKEIKVTRATKVFKDL